MKKKKERYLRMGIQLIFFLLMSSAFTAAFSGAKYIFTQIGMGEPVAFGSFLKVLIGLCAFTVIFGRFFCGFACAFGTFGDAVYGISRWIRKKRKKKPLSVNPKISAGLKYIKYILLSTILILCFMGVYQTLQGSSPWDVFSMLRIGNVRLGNYAAGVIILIFIIAGMAVCERFFCRFLCPMGAIFALLPVLPVFSLRRDRENCIPRCSACTRQCPVDLSLAGDGEEDTYFSGECIQCQKCINTCPRGNVHCHAVQRLKGNETWFTLLRAVLLFALFVWLKI